MSQIHGLRSEGMIQQPQVQPHAAQNPLQGMGREHAAGNPVSRFFHWVGSGIANIVRSFVGLFRSAHTEPAQPRLPINLAAMQDPVRTKNQAFNEKIRYDNTVHDETIAARDAAFAELAPKYGLENQPLNQNTFQERLTSAIFRQRTEVKREDLPALAKDVVNKMLVDNFVSSTIKAFLPEGHHVSDPSVSQITVQAKDVEPATKALSGASVNAPNLQELRETARAKIEARVAQAVIVGDATHALIEEGLQQMSERTGMTVEQAHTMQTEALYDKVESEGKNLLKEGKATPETLRSTLEPMVRRTFDRCTVLYTSVTELRDTKGLNPELAKRWMQDSLDVEARYPENFFTTVHTAAQWINDSHYLDVLVDPNASIEDIEKGLQSVGKLEQEITGEKFGLGLDPDAATRLMRALYACVVVNDGAKLGMKMASQTQRNIEIMATLDSRFKAAEQIEARAPSGEEQEQAIAARRMATSYRELFSKLLKGVNDYV